MMPTLRQLEYLVAVADHLHFRKAAESVHVSQPALSTQIQQLEQLMGVRFFERSRRRVLLTPAGREASERARALLALAGDWVEAVRSQGDPLRGELRLGVIPTVAPYLLPRVLPAVRHKFPELRIYLREGTTARLVEMLGEGSLDLLLLALEADLGGAETLPLFDDPFLVAAPAAHPLATGRRVREADLAAQEVMLLEDAHCLSAQALSVCRRAGLHAAGDFRASSLATLLAMVSGGLGVTLIPALAAQSVKAQHRDLVLLPFAAPVPHRTIGLAWRPTSARKDGFRLLADALRRSIGVRPETNVRSVPEPN
jgi:LysR family hydrogen peroxide-inducible transcriptional activator